MKSKKIGHGAVLIEPYDGAASPPRSYGSISTAP